MMIEILSEAEASAGIHAHEYAQLSADALIFSPYLLESCRINACGKYNKSWTCPPACETAEEQRKKILSYKKVFVFTTKHDLEDSFDYEGMTRGRDMHTLLTIEFRNRLGDGFPVYGAGSCPVCRDKDGNDSCSFPAPCRFPDKKIGSIEAAGINVTELSRAANISYNNGPNTVTYFSMILLN